MVGSMAKVEANENLLGYHFNYPYQEENAKSYMITHGIDFNRTVLDNATVHDS